MPTKAEHLRHFPQPLLDELVAGRWLPIVGAGLSRNAQVPPGLEVPLWDGLGQAIAADIPGHDYAGPLDALSAYEHEFSRRALIARLHRELLIDEATPGPAHEAFCRLRFDKVLTTNFDFLLERGYQEIGESCDVVLDEEQLPIPRRRGATVLLKMHGDLRHPGRLVVSEDDYDGFLARYPVLATHVASLLIERVPVLVGYSLDDPDFRQLLAMLKDRLGRMVPSAYVIAVDASPALVARYDRRGVKVVNLRGSKTRYGEILAKSLSELDSYWRANVLEQVQFTDEPSLEEVETSVGGKSRRLCYFSVPASRLAVYRELAFPLAEDAGLVPVSAFDVEAGPGNLLTAMRTLLERSRAAVVDVSASSGSTELLAAVQILGPHNVVLVAAGAPPAWALASGAHVLTAREGDIQSDAAAVDDLALWFLERGVSRTDRVSEAEELLRARHWRAALVAAVADFEAALRTMPSELRSDWRESRRKPTLRELAFRADLPISDDVRERLAHWIALRNSALHEGADVTPTNARRAVRDVAMVVDALGLAQ